MLKWVVVAVLLALLLVILRRTLKRDKFGPAFPLSEAAEIVVMQVEWPALTGVDYFVDRAATRDDVSRGKAIFAMEGMGVGVGTRISMPLPQYAFHLDEAKGLRRPVIVVQAERAENGLEIIGYRSLDGQGNGAALRNEFELLGTTPLGSPQ